MTQIKSTQCNRCISVGDGDCATCKTEPRDTKDVNKGQFDGGYKKPLSVRLQRSFQEHMKTSYQNIDTLVYSAEVTCGEPIKGSICTKEKDWVCAFRNKTCSENITVCQIHALRRIIGEHFEQSDITVSPDTTQSDLKGVRK